MIDVFNYLKILNLVYSYTFFPFFFSFLIIFNVKRQGEINGFGATLILLFIFIFSRCPQLQLIYHPLNLEDVFHYSHKYALTIGISDTLEAQKLGLNARRSESNGEFTRQNQNRVS